MGNISQAIGRVLTGGAKAFSRFPAAMASALIVAVSASILTQLDNPNQDRLLSMLILAFSSTFFWGMAAAALGGRFHPRRFPFILFNILVVLGGGGLFTYLYLIRLTGDIPGIILARIAAGGLFAFLIFLIVIAADKGRSDYNQAAFMVLKSSMIALLYGLVIMLGLMFVAFTVENLIYDGLDEKVYMHIAIWSGFLGIAFFLGYFPLFHRNKTDPRLEIAQKHPAFIEILFAYVMIPIMLILTVVLLVWAVQILIVGNWQEFGLLTTIFSAYALFGIFLSVMVSHYVQPTARFFARVFPIAAIVFLAFEGYAIYRQTNLFGIKTAEYAIILIWLFTIFAALVLLFNRPPANRLIAVFAALLTILAVLPITGYQAVPVASQSRRLQTVLLKNDMIIEGQIRNAPPGISLTDRQTITDAALFLMDDEYESIRKAPWLENSLAAFPTFRHLFGFEPEYEGYTPDDRIYKEINLFSPGGTVDITGYAYSTISAVGFDRPVTINGRNGEYEISLRNMNRSGTPTVLIIRDGQTVMSRSMTAYIDELVIKYEDSAEKGQQPDIDDMTLVLEQGGLKVLIVFQNITIQISSNGEKSTYLYPAAFYFSEGE